MLVKKKLCLLCILLLMACLITVSVPIKKARAISGVTITEYSGLTFPSGLTEITAGSDGALWFGEESGTKIGRITTSGNVSEWNNLYVPVCITAGPDGALWFTDQYASDTISRFTTDGSWTSYNTDLTGNSEPDGICVGPDGNLWFTEYDADSGNRIGRITTAGVITEFNENLAAGSGPRRICAGPDGNLWFTEEAGNRIGRITTAGVITEFNENLTAGSGPRGICAGPDGNLWFTEFNGNRIGRITTAGVITEFSAGLTADSNPHSICVGPDNALWFTEQGADKLGRITTSGAITEYGTTSGTKPEGICVGPDNALWFTESGLTRIGKATIQGLSSFYFAEGYTGPGFQEYLCLGNPGASAATATVTYLFNGGGSASDQVDIAANSRTTVDINNNPKVGPGREVSIQVSSSSSIICERPMYFNYNGCTGGSDVAGATSTSNTWYFAEGCTLPGFDEYVCVLNPGATAANLTFHFQTQEAGPKTVNGSVPAHSRASFHVNELLQGSYQASLKLDSSQPVVAERPMYFNYSGWGNWGWTGGNCVMGATQLAKEYFFAEGCTYAYFEEWLTLQNPGASAISVSATYQLGAGQGDPVSKSYNIEAGSRKTLFVPLEAGAGKDVSIHLTSASAFLAERPMYFCYTFQGADWSGGSCVIGAPATSADWFFAEGATIDNFHEWICLQNPNNQAATVQVTYYVQGSGALPPKTETVPGNSRITLFVNNHAGAGLQLSTKIHVTSGPGIIAERPMYFNYLGWDGGHDVVGYTP